MHRLMGAVTNNNNSNTKGKNLDCVVLFVVFPFAFVNAFTASLRKGEQQKQQQRQAIKEVPGLLHQTWTFQGREREFLERVRNVHCTRRARKSKTTN